MLFAQTRSILAGLVTLTFAATMLLPCFCATAFAADLDETSSTDCCPETGESSPGDEEQDGDACCCNGLSACGQSDTTERANLDALLGSEVDDGANLEGPTTWWTPDLVAALWLIDRIANSTDSIAPPKFHAPTDRPDRSDTYLKHATFLI